MKLNFLNFHWKPYWDANVERCGIVLLDGSIVEINNASKDPENYFVLLNEDLDKYQGNIAASWHTHTHESANLSMGDYSEYLFSALEHHVIVSRTTMAVFSLEKAELICQGWKLHD